VCATLADTNVGTIRTNDVDINGRYAPIRMHDAFSAMAMAMAVFLFSYIFFAVGQTCHAHLNSWSVIAHPHLIGKLLFH